MRRLFYLYCKDSSLPEKTVGHPFSLPFYSRLSLHGIRAPHFCGELLFYPTLHRLFLLLHLWNKDVYPAYVDGERVGSESITSTYLRTFRKNEIALSEGCSIRKLCRFYIVFISCRSTSGFFVFLVAFYMSERYC